ncbi:hypothetical protein [Paenibacillus tyrfis]|uniref:Uncharacterized protein n=1 Tax=Paenibacillus tyrfis TaxID=1501230 RepID=A0A081NTA4_9BACL|nr:hypothetical protein [Paenibacillus tyrfis]KEQ21677.1 hypothetical protein ET33_34490 [Paenibacillus tyrfis]
MHTFFIYFPLIFWVAVIGLIIYFFRKRSYNFSKKVRQFDFELSERGEGWIKIQPLEAVHIQEILQWDSKKRVMTLKDGTKKKVHKVRAFGMEKELESVRNRIVIK